MATIQASLISRSAQSAFSRQALPGGVTRDQFYAFFDAMSNAIANGMSQWQRAATLTGVMINGPVAMGGRFAAPDAGALIAAFAPRESRWWSYAPYVNAIAAGLGAQLSAFAGAVMVPGLPWYPPFAAMPAPMAPPTPNTPMPLITIASAGVIYLKSGLLKDRMMNRLSGQRPAAAEQVIGAMAEGIDQAATVWLASAMVTNVLGTGPVPTFAPPYVPVGPVVGGVGNMVPGGIV